MNLIFRLAIWVESNEKLWNMLACDFIVLRVYLRLQEGAASR